jgi:hypothetical protein
VATTKPGPTDFSRAWLFHAWFCHAAFFRAPYRTHRFDEFRRSFVMNLSNESSSRDRVRSPQTDNSEARRPARRVAMEARRQHARELGHLVNLNVR